MGNGAKNKVIIFFVSLVLAGLCLGLCFLDAEPFYPAKIAGTVIFTVFFVGTRRNTPAASGAVFDGVLLHT